MRGEGSEGKPNDERKKMMLMMMVMMLAQSNTQISEIYSMHTYMCVHAEGNEKKGIICALYYIHTVMPGVTAKK
jgi:hypothetical protein